MFISHPRVTWAKQNSIKPAAPRVFAVSVRGSFIFPATQISSLIVILGSYFSTLQQNPIKSIFKISTESDPFSLLPPPLSWWKPLYLTYIGAFASWLLCFESLLSSTLSLFSAEHPENPLLRSSVQSCCLPLGKSYSYPCGLLGSTRLSPFPLLDFSFPIFPFASPASFLFL